MSIRTPILPGLDSQYSIKGILEGLRVHVAKMAEQGKLVEGIVIPISLAYVSMEYGRIAAAKPHDPDSVRLAQFETFLLSSLSYSLARSQNPAGGALGAGILGAILARVAVDRAWQGLIK